MLYFYPKDDTPGRTTEACQFRDDYAAVQRLGADIPGVSIDNRASHAAFSRRNSACRSGLLADTDGSRGMVARSGAYGRSSSRAGIRLSSTRRGTSPRSTARLVPKTHSREVITDLKALQATTGGSSL